MGRPYHFEEMPGWGRHWLTLWERVQESLTQGYHYGMPFQRWISYYLNCAHCNIIRRSCVLKTWSTMTNRMYYLGDWLLQVSIVQNPSMKQLEEVGTWKASFFSCGKLLPRQQSRFSSTCYYKDIYWHTMSCGGGTWIVRWIVCYVLTALHKPLCIFSSCARLL